METLGAENQPTALRSDLAIDAFEMAIYSRTAHGLDGLIHREP